MEEAYESFKEKGIDTVDGVINWLKEANIIDSAKVTEENARTLFEGLSEKVDIDKMKEALDKLASDTKETADKLCVKLCCTATVMEDAYEKLRKDGHNTVENLVDWMKQAKIIEKEKAAEDKATKMFSDVKDATNVEYKKFQQVVQAMAAEQNKTLKELSDTLAREGPKFMNALAAAAGAFKDSMTKK